MLSQPKDFGHFGSLVHDDHHIGSSATVSVESPIDSSSRTSSPARRDASRLFAFMLFAITHPAIPIARDR